MIPLSADTIERVRAVFPAGTEAAVVAMLETDCADNLPFCQAATALSSERIRFAVLKLSGGDLSKLQAAVALAQVDWRDVLMGAGFGEDVSAHRAWRPWHRLAQFSQAPCKVEKN